MELIEFVKILVTKYIKFLQISLHLLQIRICFKFHSYNNFMRDLSYKTRMATLCYHVGRLHLIFFFFALSLCLFSCSALNVISIYKQTFNTQIHIYADFGIVRCAYQITHSFCPQIKFVRFYFDLLILF